MCGSPGTILSILAMPSAGLTCSVVLSCPGHLTLLSCPLPPSSSLHFTGEGCREEKPLWHCLRPAAKSPATLPGNVNTQKVLLGICLLSCLPTTGGTQEDEPIRKIQDQIYIISNICLGKQEAVWKAQKKVPLLSESVKCPP